MKDSQQVIDHRRATPKYIKADNERFSTTISKMTSST